LPQKNPFFNKQNFTFFKATDHRRHRQGEWVAVGVSRSSRNIDDDDPRLDSEYTTGVDCSYIMAYAAGSTVKPARGMAFLYSVTGVALMMHRSTFPRP
jgi:hypothetical protein